METLGLYIQVPFCASKCSFCNFGSRVDPSSVFDAYCCALRRESHLLPSFYEAHGLARQVAARPVDTIYFGGGTPSLLGAERIDGLLEAFQRRFEFAVATEFTLEVTPGSADDEFLARAWTLGINRLSIGAQSFEDRELGSVGRLHSAADTADLVRRARLAGFTNINLDLIAGLPYQTESSWQESLLAAATLRPEHISVYLFEIDEKSRLGREVLDGGLRYHAGAVPDDDFMASAYERAREFLPREGYGQYEISNFARPGYESLHNRKYWRLEPYLGLGAGAHSFDGQRRWANETTADVYQEKLRRGESPIKDVRVLSVEEQCAEFLFLGLREREGIDLNLARGRWGEQVRQHEPRIDALARDGWLELDASRVRLAERALLVSNEIFQEFLAA